MRTDLLINRGLQGVRGVVEGRTATEFLGIRRFLARQSSQFF